MTSDTFYDANGVTVTEKLITINDETFSVSQINSVTIFEEKHPKFWLKVRIAALWAVSIGSVLYALLMLAQGYYFEEVWGFFIAPIIGLIGIPILTKKSRGADSTFLLNFVTSAGQRSVLNSSDKKKIESVKAAIEKALSS